MRNLDFVFIRFASRVHAHMRAARKEGTVDFDSERQMENSVLQRSIKRMLPLHRIPDHLVYAHLVSHDLVAIFYTSQSCAIPYEEQTIGTFLETSFHLGFRKLPN